MCSLGYACGPVCSWVSVLVCGHVPTWPVSLDAQMCEPVFSGPVCRDLCVLRGHHSRWFCLNLWAPGGRGPGCVWRGSACLRGAVCVSAWMLVGSGRARGTGRSARAHMHPGAQRHVRAAQPGDAPQPRRGQSARPCYRGGSGVRLRGAERRVEPGKKPRDPFISISRRPHQVIQCVCLSLPPTSLSLFVCASSALSLALWPWPSCLHNFLCFFPLP